MMVAMTDRYAGFVVTLEENIREDDSADVITALKMIKGVLSVKPVNGNLEMTMAQQRALLEFRSELLGLYKRLSD